MKTTTLMIMLAALFAGSINAQNPSRKVLYTLGTNEEIVSDEYVLSMTLNGYKFAAITENTQTHEFRFVFNGKEIVKADRIRQYHDGNVWYEQPIDVFYLDPEREDGYGYNVNIAGRIFTRLGDKFLPNVTGYVYPFSIKLNGKFALRYVGNDERYANIDGKIFGPYQSVYDVAIADNGKFAFEYKENDKWYANIDGKILGPYQSVDDVAIADNGKFAFSYREDNKDYANIDGKIFGPYQDIVDGIVIADNGKFAFKYRENNKRYFNVNGNKVSLSGYDIAVAEIKGERLQRHFNNQYHDRTHEIISPDGKHIFYSDSEYEYVVIDSNKIGKHPAVNSYHDKQKNAFIWNTVEGKELVVYEYKL
jgi:hypothetical protein